MDLDVPEWSTRTPNGCSNACGLVVGKRRKLLASAHFGQRAPVHGPTTLLGQLNSGCKLWGHVSTNFVACDTVAGPAVVHKRQPEGQTQLPVAMNF